MYQVKETFYTLQGEGAQTGRPAVFCRFSGCNLWSGLEKHRAKAICNFCDTDFKGTDGPGGGKFIDAEQLAQHIFSFWPKTSQDKPFVVCTGGEPLLQLDDRLLAQLHHLGFEVAVETNGTQLPPQGIDWITVSPKGKAAVILTQCHELKLVYPQLDAMPDQFDHIKASYYYLTPMSPPKHTSLEQLYHNELTKEVIAYCLMHPKWRLNLQTHKLIGIA